VRLYELAYGCRLFGELAGVDTATTDLRAKTNGRVDLGDPEHAKALLVWLNKWGCRQFAIEHHSTAASMLAEWGARWLDSLPKPNASLSKLSTRQLATTADAYADLKDRQASTRRTPNGKIAIVTVGATGAGKALHALRPRVLPPWDDPMRAALSFDGGRDSYLAYLLDVQQQMRGIEAEAAAMGIAAKDIPKVLGRPSSSLPKMIDEYLWITLTRGHVPPSEEALATWTSWARTLRPTR
jgi:hypothetical protein